MRLKGKKILKKEGIEKNYDLVDYPEKKEK